MCCMFPSWPEEDEEHSGRLPLAAFLLSRRRPHTYTHTHSVLLAHYSSRGNLFGIGTERECPSEAVPRERERGGGGGGGNGNMAPKTEGKSPAFGDAHTRLLEGDRCCSSLAAHSEKNHLPGRREKREKEEKEGGHTGEGRLVARPHRLWYCVHTNNKSCQKRPNCI